MDLLKVVNTFYQYKTNEAVVDDKTYLANFTQFKTYENFKSFKENSNVVKLYETEPWQIAIENVPDVYLNADSRHVKFVGKHVTIEVLKVPLKTKPYNVHKYLVNKNEQATALQGTQSETCMANYAFK